MVLLQNVESSSESLRKRVEAVLDMALTTVTSLSEAYLSETPLIEKEATMAKETPDLSAEKEKMPEIKPEIDKSLQGLETEEELDKVRLQDKRPFAILMFYFSEGWRFRRGKAWPGSWITNRR